VFQRNVVWDRDRVKRLWDSIYKFYPLGSILVWRTGTKLQNHREIGGHELKDERTESEFHYLLDGQQRTTALLTSMYGGKIINIASLIRQCIKNKVDDERLRLFVFSMLGVILYFFLALPAVSGIVKRQYDQEFKSELVSHITAFCLEGIQALDQEP
jgi:hypothetical protein